MLIDPLFLLFLQSLTLSLGRAPTWQEGKGTRGRVSFLRRNPKLMVNYIRPATELGLESTGWVFFSSRHAPPRATAARIQEETSSQRVLLMPRRVSVTDMYKRVPESLSCERKRRMHGAV